jgi:hypothetical protein
MIISRNDYERSWQPGMPAYAGVQGPRRFGSDYAGGVDNNLAGAGQTESGQTESGQTESGQTESGQTESGQTESGQTESGQDAGNISAGTSEKSTSKSTRLMHALKHTCGSAYSCCHPLQDTRNFGEIKSPKGLKVYVRSGTGVLPGMEEGFFGDNHEVHPHAPDNVPDVKAERLVLNLHKIPDAVPNGYAHSLPRPGDRRSHENHSTPWSTGLVMRLVSVIDQQQHELDQKEEEIASLRMKTYTPLSRCLVD